MCNADKFITIKEANEKESTETELGISEKTKTAETTAEQEGKYASAATNPLTWIVAPSAYLLGSFVDGAVAMKHSISK